MDSCLLVPAVGTEKMFYFGLLGLKNVTIPPAPSKQDRDVVGISQVELHRGGSGTASASFSWFITKITQLWGHFHEFFSKYW